MNVILYIHGKGGSAAESEHYKPLFPDCEVIGLDYQTFSPWETGEEIRIAVEELKRKYENVILIANSIGAFFSMIATPHFDHRSKNAGIDDMIQKAYFISPIVDMEKLITNMMQWANVTEQKLKSEGVIHTEEQMQFLDNWIKGNDIMTITEERLRQTFSEGGAQEIYQEVKADGDFLSFARQYAFSEDYRVARSALWGLTKANKEELSQLQVILGRLIDQAMTEDNSSVRRLTLNIVERLQMNEDDLRTDFLDFCFEHMMDVEEFSGIQSVCMKLAFRMCQFYPELMDELKRTLEAMETDYYKPAVKCVRNRILNGKLK